MEVLEDPRKKICSICKVPQLLKKATVYQCGHMVCGDCQVRKGWRGSEGIYCLKCQTKEKEKTMQRSSRTQKNCCQQCNHRGILKKAQALCKTCKMGFCEECAAEHTEQSVFASHQLILVFFEDHGGDFEYICKTCIVGLCAHCILAGDHKTHDVQEKTTPTDLDANIEHTRGTLETKIVNAKEAMKSIEDDKTERVDAWDQMANGILEHWDKLKAEGDKILKDHLSVYKNGITKALKTYYAQFGTGQAAIESGVRLWKKDDTDLRVNRSWVEETIVQSVTSAREAVKTVPDPAYLCMDVWQLTDLHKIPEALQGCRKKCDMPTVFEQLKEKPTLVTDVQCTVDFCKTRKSCHICVKNNGAAIICTGGKVYEIQTDGTQKVLEVARQALMSYQHENSLYFLQQNDWCLMHASDPGVKQLLIKVDLSPLMMYFAGDVAHVFHATGIEHFRHSPPTYLKLTSEENDSLLLVERVVLDGTCKFIAILKQSHDVVILNQECEELRRFSLHTEDGRKMTDVSPGDMTVTANGHLLVADKTQGRILEFMPDGTFIREMLTDFGPGHAADFAISYRHPCLWAVIGNRNRNTNRNTNRNPNRNRIVRPALSNVSVTEKLVMRMALFRFDM